MNDRTRPEVALLDAVRAAARQEQFLEVVSAEEAKARFEKHLDLAPLAAETVSLADALGRVLAHDVAAPIDVPPFDRSNVDGFAVRAADTTGATDATPRRLTLNAEVLACGHAPKLTVAPGTTTAIATGGMIPRGADAVVMIEQTELIDAAAPAIDLRRAVSPGTFVSYAGSDIARGETLLRRGATISSREIGMLAACGFDKVDVVRRPKVAVLSTGDELAALGSPLRPGAVYDSNGAIIAAAVREAGGEPVAFGAFPDDEAKLEAAVREALKQCDMVVLSGGTSKGAGDLSHRIVSRLGEPGVIVHGVALKPGKPLCLGVVGDKPIVVLPGFPTSAIFTFHAFVAPVIRAKAGLPPEAAVQVDATVPVRIPSEMGRKEFVLVALVAARGRQDRVSDRQRLRLGHDVLAGRRLPRSRRAAHRRRSRHARESHADRAGARAGPHHRGQPLRRARCGALRAVGAGHLGAHHRDRQHGRRCGRAARRMRSRADPPDGPGDRHL